MLLIRRTYRINQKQPVVQVLWGQDTLKNSKLIVKQPILKFWSFKIFLTCLVKEEYVWLPWGALVTATDY